jgi:putative DNA primase/helicase
MTTEATLPPVGFQYGPLSDHHREHLHASGISDDTIKAAGLYTEHKPAALAALLGWQRPAKKIAPALIFPFKSADGANGYCRARPDRPRIRDGEPVKYESPIGRPNQVYIPPGVAEVLANPQSELLIVEGEKKALACTQAGFPALGLVGVWGWKKKKAERLLPELEAIPVRGRQVRFGYDSDVIHKPDVKDAEARGAKQFIDRGAVVRVVRFPDGPPDADGKPTKMGADDFIVAHGAAAFRKLLDDAQEPDAPDPEATKKEAAALDPATEGKAFLETGMADGVYRLRFWRGEFQRWSKGQFADVPTPDVRGYLIRSLNERFTRLGSGVTSCVLDQIKALSLLPASIEPPTWIEGPKGWRPDEVLSTPSGLVHLPSFIDGNREYTIPPTPKFFTFSALDYQFAADPPTPTTWQWFLECLFGDDTESIELLRQWFGLSLLPVTYYQKILFVVGPKRSGKGTICRVLTRLVGAANVCNPTLSSLADRFGLWPLIGKLLAIVSDARLSGRNDQAPIVERLLSVSGEDSQTIDRKNLPPWNGKLQTRFVICTNEVPRLHDTSGALASRMLVLQLRKTFFGEEILDLSDKLIGELPGILRWAIEGWRLLREAERFTQPASSVDVAGELADLGSPVGVFIRERCRTGPECTIPRGVLYGAYQDWAKAQGKTHIEDEAGFGRLLRAACPNLTSSQPRQDGERVRHYVGIELV